MDAITTDEETKILSINLELEEVDNELQNLQTQLNDLLQKQEHLTQRKNILTKKLKNIQNKEKDWKNEKFQWDDKVYETLQNVFQISNFRHLQKETINATLSKRDCFLIMPTGGGKSLCFQLPAVITKGFALVISPLVSLMEDQLMALKELKIDATSLNASSSKAHVKDTLNQMITENPSFKLLYVTPEKIAKSKRFMAKLEKAYKLGTISRIVIDEVHCASHWGHDFRPDYKILGILKRQFPTVPILGLTATASGKVLDDVKDILNLDDCVVFRSSFNRPNLFYEVHKTSLNQTELISDIAKRIKTEFKDMTGIVYCFSKKDSEEVADDLSKHGVKAHCYHADLSPDLKSKVHHAWSKGNLQVMVATIAFGMGIDKPNVRFVIHFSISKSIENYYQESGRAGRDDQKAWCIIYFRFQDISRQSAMVFTEKTGLKNLCNMLNYCINRTSCRRSLIGNNFDEKWTSTKCQQMCDNCQLIEKNGLYERDLFEDSKSIIEILQKAEQMDERLTPLKIVDTWLGKGKAAQRPTTLSNLQREDCEIILTKLLIEQIVREDFHFTPYSTITYLIIGPRWPLYLRSAIKITQYLNKGKKGASTGKRKSINNTITTSNKVVKEVKNDENEFQTNEKKKRKIIVIDDSDFSEEEI